MLHKERKDSYNILPPVPAVVMGKPFHEVVLDPHFVSERLVTPHPRIGHCKVAAEVILWMHGSALVPKLAVGSDDKCSRLD